MKIIARIRNPYDGKFGVPRQSGLVEQVVSTIVFEPEYRVAEALRGIEEFSHLWLIWSFDRAERENWSPTVRPPRLGGNQRVGVFATRSPFRPNAIGLSCVKLLGVEKGSEGTVLKVAGADLMNGTPIYDIKPYLPYADSKPEATGGFTDRTEKRTVEVEIPAECAKAMTERPQRMYPRQMKGLRRPTRSERAPMSRVVTVAARALNATIQAMAVGSGAMALYRNTLKYMFSMVQAN